MRMYMCVFGLNNVTAMICHSVCWGSDFVVCLCGLFATACVCAVCVCVREYIYMYKYIYACVYVMCVVELPEPYSRNHSVFPSFAFTNTGKFTHTHGNTHKSTHAHTHTNIFRVVFLLSSQPHTTHIHTHIYIHTHICIPYKHTHAHAHRYQGLDDAHVDASLSLHGVDAVKTNPFDAHTHPHIHTHTYMYTI